MAGPVFNNEINVDKLLSSISENPLQNKQVFAELLKKQEKLTTDESLALENNALQSNTAIYVDEKIIENGSGNIIELDFEPANMLLVATLYYETTQTLTSLDYKVEGSKLEILNDRFLNGNTTVYMIYERIL